VWLILARVVVLGKGRKRLVTGSEALVQCFVPETILEVALGQIDQLLRQENLRRIDVLQCTSYDEEIVSKDEIPIAIKEKVDEARDSSEASLGEFFTNPDSPRFYEDKDGPDV